MSIYRLIRLSWPPTVQAGELSSAAIQAIIDAGDITSGVANFNGNDAVGLFKNDILIDVIGQVGEDPGTAWPVADDASGTVDQTLVRKAAINMGTISWTSSAGTNADDSQWLVYSQDELSYLGSHVQFTDNEAPVVSFSPLNGSSQVTETTDITLSFDEEIFNADGSAISNDDLAAKLSFSETATPANTLPFVASISGQQIVVNPTGDLKLGMQYTLSLLANTVEDATGNENTESSTTFTVREARTVAEVASAVYTVDNSNSTISNVPYSEDLTAFKANVLALSGASYDVYLADGLSVATDLLDGYQLICVAEDGLTKKTYTINKIAFVNNETDILSFAVPGQTGEATIDADAHTLSIQVPYGSNRSALVATFTLSVGATAKVGTTPQESGVTVNNFESTVTYSIVAEDGTTNQDWQVSVTPEAPNTDASLSALFIDEVVVEGFSPAVYAYTRQYPYGTAGVPGVTYTLNDATASAELTVAESMPGTSSVKVTAQDGLTTQTYSIEFTWEAPSTEAYVTSANYLVNDTENTLTGIPYGTSLAAFKANLTPAAYASFEVYQSDGSSVATDLKSGYLVVVTAQDGTTQKTYALTLDEAPTSELFFSEYLEGSSSNKALEIYNPTGADVDLSAYSVKLATNGASWGTMQGTLPRVWPILMATMPWACLKMIYLSMSLATWV
ncbi:MAG: hypothetical protein CVU09_05570 [Bacteroidetes bacterium HGW-Bacteroidetes-4]|nr:MAG: hypothetical protein CVU09_05570 [Bacteroidetes bacterium HGW-Bacteroidetes-4]